MAKFSAVIYKLGINPVVDPPERVLAIIFGQAGLSKGPIPVCGRINGAEFVQTLVRYRGAWRLYINGEMLKASKLDVGDRANIDIAFDPRPRDVPMPNALGKALTRDKKAKAEFEALSPSRRKEIMRYIGSLKTERSILRNVGRIISHLRDEKTDAQHALMRKPKS